MESHHWSSRLLRRLLSALVSLSGAVLLCFLFAQQTPGDAFTALELDPSIPASTVALLRSRESAQQPLVERFMSWLNAAAHGDLGISIEYHRPVLTLLRERAPATVELLGLAFVMAWLVGMTLAFLPSLADWARPLRTAIDSVAAAVAAVPTAVVAVAAMSLAPARWLPGAFGLDPGTGASPQPWLAAGVLSLGLLPAVYLQASQAITLLSSRPFVTAAQAAGAGPLRLLFRHIFPNSLDFLLPFASLSIAQLMIDTVIVENLLAWPGIGQLSIDAASQRDLPVVAALVLLSSVVVVTGNLLSDLLQYLTNPQLRTA